jgi:serine/threonine-protein kinase HipA
MNGDFVGVWSVSRNSVQTFQYDLQWTISPAARALSLSMPVTAGNGMHRGAVVANYFENLLPDSASIRNRLRTRFKTKSTGAFDLLGAIGRDCVGAVRLVPTDLQPEGWDRVDSSPLADDQVEKILTSVASGVPFGQNQGNDEDFRISLAGAQEKTALLKFAGTWHRPQGATPTTHILKLPLGLVGNLRVDMSDSVENEWLCAQIVRELGLRVAHTDMMTFGSQKVLVVERFDRRWQGVAQGAQNATGFTPPERSWIARLPQEDMCQATGEPPNLKYEKDGGPSALKCLTVLAASEHADADRQHFVLTQLAFWLLAATDGHAKNFSIAHQRGGNYVLTPLYDVLSAWPVIGAGSNLLSVHDVTLAMALHSKSNHYKLNEIRVRHWANLAHRCGVAGTWERMLQMVQSTDEALRRVEPMLPNGFPAHVWARVRDGMNMQARKFLRENAL